MELNLQNAPTEIFCSSCRLKFEDLTSYKLHLSTEFHVYNARRRTADLQPISLKLFEQKKKDLLSVASSEQSEHVHYCKLCRRRYQSAEQLEVHLRSKKHKANAKKTRKNSNSTLDDVSAKDSEVHEDSANPTDEHFVDKSLTENSKIEEPRKTTMDNLRICMFCNKDNNEKDGVLANLEHMRIKHGFYVLDIDCLISLKALMYYLAEKIHVGHLCIHCNKSFETGRAAQNHMLDKSHCAMNSELFEEECFYDFSPTYEENFKGKTIADFDLSEEPLAKLMSTHIVNFQGEEAESQEDGKQGDPVLVEVIEEENQDGEWEDVDDDQAEDMKTGSVTGSFQKVSAPSESTFTLIENAESQSEISAAQNKTIPDEAKSLATETGLCETEAAQLIERRKQCRSLEEDLKDTFKKAKVLDTGEIHLPSGKIIGHRQWFKEYKQHLPLLDRSERQVMQKLGIEYKKMGQLVVTNFNREIVSKTYQNKYGKKAKFVDKEGRMFVKLGWQNNLILRKYYVRQFAVFG